MAIEVTVLSLSAIAVSFHYIILPTQIFLLGSLILNGMALVVDWPGSFVAFEEALVMERNLFHQKLHCQSQAILIASRVKKVQTLSPLGAAEASPEATAREAISWKCILIVYGVIEKVTVVLFPDDEKMEKVSSSPSPLHNAPYKEIYKHYVTGSALTLRNVC